jgi:hypothetical protein
MVIIRAGLLQARLGHQLDHYFVVDGDKIGASGSSSLPPVLMKNTSARPTPDLPPILSPSTTK